VKASAPDVVGLVRELVRETRRGGIPTSREVASSDTFLDDIERRAVRARREYRAKFAKVKTEIERELGTAQEHEENSENIVALWKTGGTAVRLTLAREDKEMPFVLTVSAEHDAPLFVDVTAPEHCVCSTLTTTKDPFIRTDLVLMKNNPAIKKRHVRLAEAKVGSTIVRLYQCRGCRRFRQSGDAGVQYVFEVPAIAVEEWKREPYVDHFASKMYEARLASYLKDAERPQTTKRCCEKGCRARMIQGSILCLDHHTHGRPVPPPGRALA
jgi:hypothetical protein